MSCDCIKQMDAKLAPHNTRLAVTFGFSRATGKSVTLPTILVEKVESRKRGSEALAIASFCPFCGERYDAPATNAQAGGGVQ